MRTALTIAGSDTSGGAGIQADLKAMTLNGVFAMSAITALTAQNTTGVTDIMEATPHFLAEELDAVFTDIFPDAVKIGMVSSSGLIEVIAEKLRFYKARHIVVDPVMVATSGSRLLQADAVGALENALLPLAEVCTPNIPEAEILSEMEIKSPADMEKAAKAISERFGCAVLCKGRARPERRQRPPLRGRRGALVLRQADSESQHPRHRLHALERDCREPRQGLQPPRQRRAREGLSLRRAERHARPRPWARADESRVRHKK